MRIFKSFALESFRCLPWQTSRNSFCDRFLCSFFPRFSPDKKILENFKRSAYGNSSKIFFYENPPGFPAKVFRSSHHVFFKCFQGFHLNFLLEFKKFRLPAFFREILVQVFLLAFLKEYLLEIIYAFKIAFHHLLLGFHLKRI